MTNRVACLVNRQTGAWHKNDNSGWALAVDQTDAVDKKWAQQIEGDVILIESGGEV